MRIDRLVGDIDCRQVHFPCTAANLRLKFMSLPVTFRSAAYHGATSASSPARDSYWNPSIVFSPDRDVPVKSGRMHVDTIVEVSQ